MRTETSDDSTDEQENNKSSQNSNSSDSKNYFYGKNRFKWAKKEPVRNVSSPLYNAFRLPVVRRDARTLDASPLSAFNKIFDDEIIDHVLHWTNMRLLHSRTNNSSLETNSSYRQCSKT